MLMCPLPTVLMSLSHSEPGPIDKSVVIIKRRHVASLSLQFPHREQTSPVVCMCSFVLLVLAGCKR